MFERTRVYENGQSFQQAEVGHYFIDYVNQGSDVLFVTFEGLFPKIELEPWQRYPWGGKFLAEQGFSVLGVKTTKSCWYRGKALHEALESTAVGDILKGYKRVIFYGESMGGYAALAFSGIHRGADVLCYAPQTSLDEAVTPWDDRYVKYGRAADWTGRFKDAAAGLDHVGKAYVVYDPFCKYDLRHVQRLPQDKIIALKAPFLDHEVCAYLSGMQLLKPSIAHLIDGTLGAWFPGAVRIRKTANVYLSNLHYALSERAAWKKDIDGAIGAAQKSLEHNIKNRRALNLAKVLIARKTRAYGDN